MGTPAVKVLREARVAKPERVLHEAQTARLARAALRVMLAKGPGVALVLVARTRGPRVRVGRVKRGAQMHDRLELPLGANRLIRTGNQVCGQRVARVGRALRAAQALVRAVPRPVARAAHLAAVGPASQVLDVRRQVPATVMQIAQASHAQHRVAMIGNPRGQPRTSLAWASQNPREAIARQNLGDSQAGTRHHFAADESLLSGSLSARSAIAGQAFYPEPCVNRWYSKIFLLNTC